MKLASMPKATECGCAQPFRERRRVAGVLCALVPVAGHRAGDAEVEPPEHPEIHEVVGIELRVALGAVKADGLGQPVAGHGRIAEMEADHRVHVAGGERLLDRRVGRGDGVELLGERQRGAELGPAPVVEREPIGDAEERGPVGQGAAGVVGALLHRAELGLPGPRITMWAGPSTASRPSSALSRASSFGWSASASRPACRSAAASWALPRPIAAPPALQPPRRGFERLAGGRQVAGHHFRLALPLVGEVGHQAMGDAGVQVAPLAAEDRGIGRILDQRVLEEERTAARRRLDEAGLEHRLERLLQRLLGLIDHRRQQGRGELAPDHRADLHEEPGRPEVVEARGQKVGQRLGQVVAPRSLRRVEHHARHLFDEQRDAVGALDDPVDVAARKAGVEADRLGKTRRILGRQPLEPDMRHVPALSPAGLSARPRRGDQQQAGGLDQLDHLRDQVARGRIGPVQILVDDDQRGGPASDSNSSFSVAIVRALCSGGGISTGGASSVSIASRLASRAGASGSDGALPRRRL